MLLCGVDASFMQKCYVFITYMMGDGGCLKLTKVLLLTHTMVEWDCLIIEGNVSSIALSLMSVVPTDPKKDIAFLSSVAFL